MKKKNNPAYFEADFSTNSEFDARLSNATLTFNTDLVEKTTINRDHKVLKNRDLPDQHPISAITGLQEALDSKQSMLTASGGVIIDNNNIFLDDLILNCGTSTTVI